MKIVVWWPWSVLLWKLTHVKYFPIAALSLYKIQGRSLRKIRLSVIRLLTETKKNASFLHFQIKYAVDISFVPNIISYHIFEEGGVEFINPFYTFGSLILVWEILSKKDECSVPRLVQGTAMWFYNRFIFLITYFTGPTFESRWGDWPSWQVFRELFSPSSQMPRIRPWTLPSLSIPIHKSSCHSALWRLSYWQFII